MNNGFEIRPLTLEEMEIPVSWAKAEGWNPGLLDASPFWHTDPNGFLGGFLYGKPVGVISAVRYDGKDDPAQRGSFGFVGFYIAHPDFRRQAYAWKLGKAAIAHLADVTSIGLDGVVERQENYQAFGFNYAHRNARYCGLTPLPAVSAGVNPDEQLVDANTVDFEALCCFDAAHFPTTRKNFLKRWISQKDHLSLAITTSQANDISAFGVIRPCFDGYKIGPLFAKQPQHAAVLLQALTIQLPPDTKVFLDPPVDNTKAISLLRTLGMSKVFETARMYKGLTPSLPTHQIYGITSFELG
jgi:ribosomal protein S18 acetylase RimI-like enzyme